MDTFPPSEISGFEWGDIIGVISTQSDLMALLNAKQASLHGGPVTLTAGATTTVNNAAVTANSLIFLFPTNLAATVATLVPYISGKSAGVSFTITHIGATGSETFNYLIVN